jgi:hypothetical protein
MGAGHFLLSLLMSPPKKESLLLRPNKVSMSSLSDLDTTEVNEWDHGEVEWDISEQKKISFTFSYESIMEEKIGVEEIQIQEKTPSEFNTFLLEAIVSGFFKVIYNEFVRMENVVLEINDLAYNNLSGHDISNDMLMLFLSVFFTTIKKTPPLTMSPFLEKKPETETWRKYVKIRRNASLFFFIMMAVFTKNVQHVF